MENRGEVERERREVRRVDDMRVPHAKSASQS